MPYKDKEKQREAKKEAMRRYRGQGTTEEPQGTTEKGQGTTVPQTLDTPQDVKAAITALTGKWHPFDQWTPDELAAHQARIKEHWCCTGDWNAAYHDLAPAMGWGRR